MKYIHQIRLKMIAFQLKMCKSSDSNQHTPFLTFSLYCDNKPIGIHYINIFCCYDLDT